MMFVCLFFLLAREWISIQHRTYVGKTSTLSYQVVKDESVCTARIRLVVLTAMKCVMPYLTPTQGTGNGVSLELIKY